jgi:hypothetical protein
MQYDGRESKPKVDSDIVDFLQGAAIGLILFIVICVLSDILSGCATRERPASGAAVPTRAETNNRAWDDAKLIADQQAAITNLTTQIDDARTTASGGLNYINSAIQRLDAIQNSSADIEDGIDADQKRLAILTDIINECFRRLGQIAGTGGETKTGE